MLSSAGDGFGEIAVVSPDPIPKESVFICSIYLNIAGRAELEAALFHYCENFCARFYYYYLQYTFFLDCIKNSDEYRNVLKGANLA